MLRVGVAGLTPSVGHEQLGEICGFPGKQELTRFALTLIKAWEGLHARDKAGESPRWVYITSTLRLTVQWAMRGKAIGTRDVGKKGGPEKGHSLFILLFSGLLLFSIRHEQLSGTRSCQSNATISSPAAAIAGGVVLVCGQG